jgi:hypothetical protein
LTLPPSVCNVRRADGRVGSGTRMPWRPRPTSSSSAPRRVGHCRRKGGPDGASIASRHSTVRAHATNVDAHLHGARVRGRHRLTPSCLRRADGSPPTKDENSMRTRSKLLFASLGAAVLLSMAVGSASARDLSITNPSFRIVWARLHLGSTGGVSVDCPVTLEGRFHSNTIHKTIGALIGNMTRGTVVGGSCTGGTATVNQEALPWHIRYGGFSGTLPTITLIFTSLIGAKFTVTSAGQTCVSQTTVANPARGRIIVETGGRGRDLTADERALIPLRGSFFCQFAGEGFFSGIGRVTLLGNTTIISIRLI